MYVQESSITALLYGTIVQKSFDSYALTICVGRQRSQTCWHEGVLLQYTLSLACSATNQMVIATKWISGPTAMAWSQLAMSIAVNHQS